MKHNRIVFCLLSLILVLTSCQGRKYDIGVSLCVHNDWNRQQSRDLLREANSHPEIELDIIPCTKGAEQQIADIRKFIKEEKAAILISPDGTEALKPVVDEAIAARIPVIIIDSDTTSCNYTASVCVDNIEIGRRSAQYAAYVTAGHGKILNILGIPGASATFDRLKGYREVLQQYPSLEIVDSCYTDWSYENALPLIDSLLQLHPDINIIATQSDPLALAAYEVCRKHNLAEIPIITGVDGLSGANDGIEGVEQGKISATCINPTGGLESIHIILDILQKKPYRRNNKLDTQLVDKDNVRIYRQQEMRVDLLNQRIEDLNGELGFYLKRSHLLQMIITIAILLILLAGAFAIYISWSRKQRRKLRKKMVEANQAKLNFFTNVSHSFRTPLTLIADPIRTMRQEGDLTDRQKELLDMMQKQSDQLLELTDQVLKVLQNDLLKDGTALDAVAQSSVENAQSATELRNKTFGEQQEIKVEECKETVLIIDDNAEIRHYLTLILTSKNYQVLTAPNGEEGLLVAQQNIPDLIICDVMMPVMDGLECCRRLKADTATSYIPVLLLTAYALDDQRIQGYQSGADAYITKPFNTEVLCARIVNLITSRKRVDPRKDPREEIERVELGAVDREFVLRFHDFVIQNMGDVDLDIQQLSDEFNMSRVQLYRKSKSITGKSPIEIIRDIRLKSATELLKKSDKSVSEIAYEVGFSSPSYFAKCYKDQYGESPTDVQKRARGNVKA